MDFIINEPNENTVRLHIIDSNKLTVEEISKIFSPIRKATNKNLGFAPTMVSPKPWSAREDASKVANKDTHNYSIDFIGGNKASMHIVRTVVDDFTRHLRAYAKSNSPLETYISGMKKMYGITPKEDIKVVSPEEEIKRKLARKYIPAPRPRAAAKSL